MTTVKELITFLQQQPENARVIIHEWDCYNDEPYDREVRPYVTGRRRKVVHL